jgi:RNA polymerase sigma factor (sigma-70 family)
MTMPALPAPPARQQSRTRLYSKFPYSKFPYSPRLAPERLYAANLGLVGLSLKRFPFLTGEARDEAYSAGLLGLWIAAQRFDPARGFTFGTFSCGYIRGYILHRLEAEGRQTRLSCVSLAAPLGEDGGELADMIADTEGEKPGEKALDAAGFEAWMDWLPVRQQDILRAVYVEEKSLSEIGANLGITRQAVHHLHASALETLRNRQNKQYNKWGMLVTTAP